MGDLIAMMFRLPLAMAQLAADQLQQVLERDGDGRSSLDSETRRDGDGGPAGDLFATMMSRPRIRVGITGSTEERRPWDSWGARSNPGSPSRESSRRSMAVLEGRRLSTPRTFPSWPWGSMSIASTRLPRWVAR